MRLFFAILLCLAIPLQGWAAGAGVQAPCPMGDMVAMEMDMRGSTGSAESAALADCCNDAATAALTGKLCKSGQECHVSAGWIGGLSQPSFQAQPTGDLLVSATPTPPRGAPASVWRPPTL